MSGIVVALALAVSVAGCGETDGTSAGESQLPSVAMVDVATGKTVDLRSYAPSATPILAWFWAPH